MGTGQSNSPALNRTSLPVWALLTVVSVGAGCGPTGADGPMVLATSETAPTGSEALFIAVHAVSADVAWAAGTGGSFARTTDGGSSWTVRVVEGADSLQFRDVHALDAQTAWLLSIGNGADSRIYRTSNGGQSWDLQFQNDLADGFFDCMSFWDDSSGIAFSDAVDAQFVIITTDDAGETWVRIPPDALPPALDGEGSFAASGTCLATEGDSTAYIGTGAAGEARMLITRNRGASWKIVDTPIVGGSAAGVASVAFRDALNGIAVGGDLGAPDSFAVSVAITNDGGRTWAAGGTPSLPGMLYGVAVVDGAPTPTYVATNPRGVTYSTDNGLTWSQADTLNYWGVDFAPDGSGWTSGTDGKITRRFLVPTGG